MKKHIIWSDYDLDLEDWREFLQEDIPDASDEELYERMYELNADYLEDERMNLNIQVGSAIVVIAELNLWDGKKYGYGVINSGNIKDCLSYGLDYTTFYLDGNDLWCDAVHHDGTNHYLFRAVKPEISEQQLENFLDKIYNEKHTRKDISRYTRCLGHEIKAVYGW